MVGRFLVLSVVTVLVLTACAGSPSHEPVPHERTIAYLKIIRAFPTGGRAQVGWLDKQERVYEDGVRVVVDVVKDLDFAERGYISSEGRAVKYVDKAPAYRDAIGEARHYVELMPGAREYLVAQLLDLPGDTELEFVTATLADIPH